MKEALRVLRIGKTALRKVRIVNERMIRKRVIIERKVWGKDTTVLKTWRNVAIKLPFWVRKEERDFRKYQIFALTCAYIGTNEMSYLNSKRNCKINRDKMNILIRVDKSDMKFIRSQIVLDKFDEICTWVR